MTAASYPNFAGKHAGEALLTAAESMAYQRRVGARGDEPAPEMDAAALFAVALASAAVTVLAAGLDGAAGLGGAGRPRGVTGRE